MESINIIKIFVMLLATIMIFAIILYKGKMKKNTTFKFLIYSFILILLHSLFFSTDVSQSVLASLHALLVMVFILLFGSSISFKQISKILKIIIIGISIVVLVSSDISLVFMGKSHFIEGNFHGVLGNANYLGAIISIFLLPLFLTMKSRKKVYKYVNILVIINLVYVLLLTRSRASLGVFAVVLMYLYLHKIEFNKIKNYIIFIMVILPIAVIIYHIFLVDIIFKYADHDSIIGTREILWITRIEAISQKPLLGWGYSVNNFSYISDIYQFNAQEKGNTILAILEELGLILGSMFIIFLTYIFTLILRKDTLIFFKLVIIATLTHLIFETWLFNFNGLMTLIFWLIVYLAIEYDKKE